MKKLLLLLTIIMLSFLFGCLNDENAGSLQFIADASAKELKIDSHNAGYLPLAFVNQGKSVIEITHIRSSEKSFIFLKEENLSSMIHFPYVVSGGEKFDFFLYHFDKSYGKTGLISVDFRFLGNETIYSSELSLSTNAQSEVIDLVESSGLLVYQPNNLNVLFQETPIGRSSEYLLGFQNISSKELIVENISFQRGITFSWANMPIFPMTLDVNAKSEELLLLFSPTDATLYSDYIIIKTSLGTFSISLAGTGVINTGPVLSIEISNQEIFNNSEFDSGYNEIGDEQILPILIKNDGRANLEIKDIISSNDQFSFNETSFVVTPNTSKTINLTYTIAREEKDASYISVLSNDLSVPSFLFTVIGEGVPASKPRLEISGDDVLLIDQNSYHNIFAVAGVNEKMVSTITLANGGLSDLVISSIDGLASPFSWEGTAPTFPLTIVSNATVDLQIAFNSSVEKTFMQNLSITSNHLAVEASVSTLSLRGTASVEKPLLNPNVVPLNLQTDLNPNYLLKDENIEFEFSTAVGSGGIGEFKYSVKIVALDSYVFSNATASATDGVSATVSFPLSDGLYLLEVQEKDDEGNWSNFTTFSLEVDKNLPLAPILSPSIAADKRLVPQDKRLWTNDLSPSWSWIDSGITGEIIYWQYLMNEEPSTSTNWQDLDLLTTTKKMQNLQQGENIFYVRGVDKFGRKGLVGQDSLFVDTVGPSITLRGNLSVTQEVDATSGTFVDSGVESVDDGVGVDLTSGSFIWKNGVICTGRSVGTFNFNYRMADKLGNFSTSSQERSIRINDTQPPVITIASDLTTDGVSVDFRSNVNLDTIIRSNSGITVTDNSGATLSAGLVLGISTVADPYKAGQQKIFFSVKDSSNNYAAWKYFILKVTAPALDGGGQNMLTDPGFEEGTPIDKNKLSAAWTLNPIEGLLWEWTRSGGGNYYFTIGNTTLPLVQESPQGPVFFYSSGADEKQRSMAGVVSSQSGQIWMTYQSMYCPFDSSASNNAISARSGTQTYLIRNGQLGKNGSSKEFTRVQTNRWAIGLSVDLRNNITLKKGFKYRASIWYVNGDGRGGSGTAESFGLPYAIRVGIYDATLPQARKAIAENRTRNWTYLETSDSSVISEDKVYSFSLANYMTTNANNDFNVTVINPSDGYAFVKYDDASLWCTGYDTHAALNSQNAPTANPSF